MAISSVKTIQNTAEYKHKEKGSVFISKCYPVASPLEIENLLDGIRKKYYDATHHCYAYKLLDGIIKYSDDGEPSGTAGIRILNAIEHFELTNILVVVIRYFGGTKLGVGPLGKAYYTSAFEVLANVKKIEKKLYKKIRINYDYEQTNKIHYLLSKYSAAGISNGFNERPFITCLIEKNKAENFSKELFENTAGKIKIDIEEEDYLM